MPSLKRRLEENLDILKKELGYDVSFDVILRQLRVGDKDVALLFIDGLVSDQALQGVLRVLFLTEPEDLAVDPLKKMLRERVAYGETLEAGTFEEVVRWVLAGPVAMLIEGEDRAIIIDLREYPARSPDEPDLERVLRGARDGLVETVIFNIALIRRRLRDPRLRVEMLTVGRRSRTDVAVLYLQDVANPDLVETVKREINRIDVDGIPMAEKSIEEFLTSSKPWWNPLPVVRYTERPDVAAVHLLEGHVVVLVDTSPSAMILPATLFHHLQHAEEYRQEVSVGAYLRWVRLAGITLSWLLPPIWVLAVLEPGLLPPGLRFIGPQNLGQVPIFLQFLFAEVGIDLIRMALVHTPSALATSLGFIGAILLGEIAVNVGLFASETILYVIIAALGTFATPSMELGLAVRLFRLALLLLVGLFRLPGLILGLALNLVLLVYTRSFGVSYLWPLLPLDAGALKDVLFRRPLPSKRWRPAMLKPLDRKRRPGRGRGRV